MQAYPKTDAEMASHWNELGAFWVETQQRLDERLRPYGDALLEAAAPAPGERALDIGCGCGDTTLALARLVDASGEALGLDVSAPMIAHARHRAAQLRSSATFVAGDAGTTPLPRAHFDLAISRLGVMFFERPARALAHLRASMKPGGRLVFVCWRTLAENPWMQELAAAVAPFTRTPARPDPEAPGPFSFSDPGRVGRILADAGFDAPAFIPFDCEMDMGSSVDAAVAEYTQHGSIAALLKGLDDQTRTRAVAAVHAVLATHLTEIGVRMGSAAWIVQARAA